VRQKKRNVVKTWLHGHYDWLLKELATEDHPGFKNFTGVPTRVFRELLRANRLATA